MAMRFNARVLHQITNRLANRARSKLPGTPERRAAVVLPLCNVNGTASVLFTKRTDDVGTHKGQVSFPGGHLDAGETPTQAAVRELSEELGALPAEPEVLGSYDDALAITGTHVTPVVGFLPGDGPVFGDINIESFAVSEAEVEYAFTLPLSHLMNPEHVELQTLTGRQFRTAHVPVFDGGPAPVWGLTAYMLSQIMREIVLPAFVDAHQLVATRVVAFENMIQPTDVPTSDTRVSQ